MSWAWGEGIAMSKTRWTEDQVKAITHRGQNILVSAAAGAGKTAVLVERIIHLLLDTPNPPDVDRVLVVTFTNAAANEMKERIGAALLERRKQNPDDKRLSRQLLLLNKAAVSTLHSFCMDIIRHNYEQLILPGGLSLDPRFRIADDTEMALLKLDVLEELFEDKYNNEEKLYLELVEGFGGERDDKLLQDLVLKIYEFSRSQPHPDLWLNEACSLFKINQDYNTADLLFGNLLDSIRIPLEEANWKIKEAVKLASAPGGPGVYLPVLYEDRDKFTDILNSELEWDSIQLFLEDITFAKLRPCRGDVDENLKIAAQKLRNDAKDALKKIKQEYFSRSRAELLSDMNAMAPLMESLCGLVEDFSFRLLGAKIEKNVVEFSDLEHFTLDLLRQKTKEGWIPSPLAVRLQNRFVEVLVDEYQDINNVQEAILSYVKSGANMFMVGDVKQSIYGFRLADPHLFLDKYNRFGKSGSSEERIILARNFRSRKQVVEAVNFLFLQVFCPRLGGIAYDRDAELIYTGGYPDESDEKSLAMTEGVELCILDTQDTEGAADNEQGEAEEGQDAEAEDKEEIDSLQMEARIVAGKILGLVGKKVWDKGMGQYRELTYRDVVVLLRSTRTAAPAFLEEFRVQGIPAYADIGSGYFAAQEVQLMLSLLKIIDNPRQDIPLAAVLRSPITGLSAVELTEIRLYKPKGDFYDAVRLAAKKGLGKEDRRLKEFLKKLHIWRTYSRRNSLPDLIWRLYSETGYYDYAGALPGGKQRQANLRALYNRAAEYESTNLKGLFKFLRFLEKIQETNNDLGTARALGEREDVVRIMSIHKSKGLEFPVVFLAGLGRKFNLTDLRAEILTDKDLGLGPPWVDCVNRFKYPTLVKLAIRNKLKRELLAEEARILYVALTRARESLVLVGSVKGLEKRVKKWGMVMSQEERELPLSLLTGAMSYLDWIVPALLRHPDGLPLRSFLGVTDGCLFSNAFSRWNIRLTDKKDIQEIKGDDGDNNDLGKIRNLLPLRPEQDFSELVAQRLEWKYPHKAATIIPAKLSVTEIKHHYQVLAQDQESSPTYSRFREFTRKPLFIMEESALSASERGTALHLAMRHLDLSADLSKHGLEEQLHFLVEKGFLTGPQAKIIDVDALAYFFNGSLGQRLINSSNVMREVPFTLSIPAALLYPRLKPENNDIVVVQGAIDCLFWEQDSWILVDYKTDMITRDTIPRFIERYRVQLDIYSRAVETILHNKVAEKILYSFQLGEAIIII